MSSKGWESLDLVSKKAENATWVKHNLLKGDDQIAAFIKAVSETWTTAPDDWVSYEFARRWTPWV